MSVALVLLFVVVVSVLLLRRKHTDTPAPTVTTEKSCEPQQCGVGCFCDDKTLQRAVRTDIVYFEDEELDRYRGMATDAYDDAAVDAFHEVLTTLRPDEVVDWLRSLELRGLQLPDTLKDEAYLLMEVR